jgi:hypothetical protein
MTWPFAYQGLYSELGHVAATSLTQAFTSGALNTEGSWAQLGAATTPRHAKGMIVCIDGNGTTNTFSLVDIGVGTTGNEVAIYSDLMAGSASNRQNSCRYWLPCDVPAGTQINVRCRSNSAALAVNVQVLFFYGSFMGGQYGGIVDTYGAVTATSKATNIADGGANTKNANYATIAASTTRHHKGLIVATQCNSTATAKTHFLDVAIGSAGNEKVIIPNLQLDRDGSAGQHRHPIYMPIPVNIPSGTRLSVNMQSSATTNFNVMLYGIS